MSQEMRLFGHASQATNRSNVKMMWFINYKKPPIKTSNHNDMQSYKKFLEKTDYFAYFC